MVKKLFEKKTSKAPSWLRSRTKSECNAYDALPWMMQNAVQRNPKYRYAKRIVYRADLLFPESKVWIEIDGSSHIGKEKKDKRRDERLTQRGYVVIRFQNEETEDANRFLYKLLFKLQHIEDRQDRKQVNDFIKCLENILIYNFDDEEYGIDDSELDVAGLSIEGPEALCDYR